MLVYTYINMYTCTYMFSGHLITKRLMIPCAHAPAFAAYPVGNYSDIYRMQLRNILATVISKHAFILKQTRVYV